MSTPIRFLEQVGVLFSLRRYWDGQCVGAWTYHDAEREVLRNYELNNFNAAGEVSDYHLSAWPNQCVRCGALAPDSAEFQVFHQRLFRAADGSEVGIRQMKPGDMYYEDWSYHNGKHWCHAGWENCDGRHLKVITPSGDTWNIDGRASNCTLLEDRTHRCWVRHGLPEKGEPVHVDKAGHTCNAGAGSIITGPYHGFLHNGVLTDGC